MDSERSNVISLEEAEQGNDKEIVVKCWCELLKGTDLVLIDVHTPMWLWSRGKFEVEIKNRLMEKIMIRLRLFSGLVCKIKWSRI